MVLWDGVGYTKAVIVSLLVCTLCLPLPSLCDSDFHENFLLLVITDDEFATNYYTAGALAFSTSYFGQGIGPILMDNVLCNGSESSLLECNHLSQSNCVHREDAGVRCRGNKIHKPHTE